MTNSFIIEPLTAKHIREGFDCGIESLNEFLKRFARQNNEKGLGRTYVAVRKGDIKVCCGYYTIASGSIAFETVPDNLPRYPVPVVHLGRLAVDNSCQGQKLGRTLLADALKRAIMIADQLGIYAVELHALTEAAREFYLKFGFTELADEKLHLYMTVKKIRKALVHKSK